MALSTAPQPQRPRTAPLPRLLSTGLAVLAIAGLVDVAVHLIGGPAAWETPAHVTVLVGMVATLAGVLHGSRSHANPSHENKERPNAIR